MNEDSENLAAAGWLTRNGFRRMADAVIGAFRGGGTGPVITATGTLPSGVLGSAPVIVQAKAAQADPCIKSRTNATKEKLEVWDNMIRPQVMAALAKAFHPENFLRMQWVVHANTNVMRRVINDVCVLYENPAKRKVKEDAKDQLSQTQDTSTVGQDGNATDSSSGGVGGQGGGEADSGQAKPGDKAPPKRPFGKPIQQAANDAAGGGAPDGADTGGPVLNTGDPDVDALATILDLSGTSDKEDTPFDKLMKAYDWDVLLDQVEKLCMISPVVWVRPVVSYDKDDAGQNIADSGRLNYIVYTPAEADVVLDPNDPTQAIAFYYYADETVYSASDAQTRKVIHFWSKTMYHKLDTEWRPLQPPEAHNMKRLPVTPFRIQLPRNGYFVEGMGDDLLEATIELCVLKTLQNSRTKDGAFKQLAIQGDPKTMPADIVMGGPSPVILGEENSAMVLDLQPQLDQFTNMWKEREVSLANTYGISAAEYKNEGLPQSGFAKKLDRDKVLKESRRRRKFFQRAEQDLYNLTALVLEEFPLPGIGKLDPSAEIVTDFSEPTFEEDPVNQAKIDAIQLKFNAISVIDVLRRENPDLTDVELVELAHKNKRINEVFMTSDQMRLVDILASGAIAGASLDAGGGKPPFGGPPGDGAPPQDGGGDNGSPPQDGPPKKPFPFGGK